MYCVSKGAKFSLRNKFQRSVTVHGDIVTNKELGMVVFPALRRLGQEDCKFKASLSYHERPENSNANEHFKELK